MEIQVCFLCASIFPQRGFYCPVCSSQVRCKSCSDILEPNAKACIMCGTKVDEVVELSTSNVSIKSNPGTNIIEFRETHKSRFLRATFTDKVGSGLNKTLSLLIANRIGAKAANGQEFSIFDSRAKDQKQLSLPIKTLRVREEFKEEFKMEKDGKETQDEQRILLEDIQADADEARKIFRFDDNGMVNLIEPRLKAKNRSDYAKRLTYLFLYCKELKGQSQVKRTDLNSVLDNAKVYDGHIRQWIANSPHLLRNNSLIELNESGKEEARRVLNEIHNPDIQNSWMPGAIRKSKRETIFRTIEKQNSESDKPKESKKSKGASSSSTVRPSLKEILDALLVEGFFKERQIIKDITSHISNNRAYHYKSREVASVLIRFIRDRKLKREKNSDEQFEYFT